MDKCLKEAKKIYELMKDRKKSLTSKGEEDMGELRTDTKLQNLKNIKLSHCQFGFELRLKTIALQQMQGKIDEV